MTLTLHDGRTLTLERPRIMGVLNVTPDSFSDGGRHDAPDAAVAHAGAMLAAGADLIDVGGESTRPGSQRVSAAEQIARTQQVIARIRAAHPQAILSIDTTLSAVAEAALDAGADVLNDVAAGREDPGLLALAAQRGCPIVLMHMQGEPGTMQDAPHYDDVIEEVRRFLADRIFACELAGIPRSRIVVDPGFGFGKTLEHNLTLLARLDALADLDVPLMAGMSRKRMIGELTGRELGERAAGSAAAHLLAAERGALLLRSHDIPALRDALALWEALKPLNRPQRPGARPKVPSWPEDD